MKTIAVTDQAAGTAGMALVERPEPLRGAAREQHQRRRRVAEVLRPRA